MISILALLIFSALLSRCRLPCLDNFTRGLYGSGLSGMDCLSTSLQAHDLVGAPVELSQRFTHIILEYIAEGCLRLHL